MHMFDQLGYNKQQRILQAKSKDASTETFWWTGTVGVQTSDLSIMPETLRSAPQTPTAAAK